jgi:hypothetical protein
MAAALRGLEAALREHGRPHMIIGGIAVIARGVPRTTRDIDATVAGAGTDLAQLVKILEAHGIGPRIEHAIDFARQNQVLLLRHQASAVDIDLSLAWLPFEEEALAHAEVTRVADVAVPVARAEDLVVYTVVAWRPQDRQDIERLLHLHGPSMDLERVRLLARAFCEALDAPERLESLEKLLGGVGSA